jgi:hypothetical protein
MTTAPSLEFGHWHLFEKQDEPWAPITTVDQYRGEEHLHFACTQLDRPAKEQNRIVDQWCQLFMNEELPAKKIWLHSRISQKIFDALCCQSHLEGLWIKWGVYPNIQGLAKLPGLKYLHLGGGASIEDISAVAGLKELVTFEADKLYQITDYDLLAQLPKLEDLSIEGDPYASLKKVTIRSLGFLEQLPQLIRLNLTMTTIADHSYLPILNVPSLKHLSLPNDKDLKKDLHLFERFFK